MYNAVSLLLGAVALLGTTVAPVPPTTPVPGAERPPSGVCGALREVVLAGGAVACSHGPDPAPDGVDMTEPFDPAQPRAGLILPDNPSGSLTSASAGAGEVGCYGTGLDGNRVQAIYARPSDRPDRYAAVVDSIRTFAAEVDAVFSASAGALDDARHIRFVTGARCQLVVDKVVLSSVGDDSLDNTIVELAARGYTDPSRKYLVWMDSTVMCGEAAYYLDDSASDSNFNNGHPAADGVVARVDSGCWGLADRGESVEAHELMHSLGSVLPSAPHATARGHCQDDADRMCYQDGSAVSFESSLCEARREALFDCGSDDYFNPSPAPGSYLDTHWNTARSSFLTSKGGQPVITIGDARVVEGDSGRRNAVFTVSLESGSPTGASVRWFTSNGTAKASDFDAASGLVSIPPGKRSGVIKVRVRGDTADEGNETFLVTLHSPQGAPLVDSRATGRIADDDPEHLGYRLVASDGGIFAFGEAPFYGSTGSIKLAKPINGMAGTPSGRGYWMVASDGGIFAFGDAGFHGSLGGGQPLDSPVAAMAPTPSGAGYWMATARGRVVPFGDAQDLGADISPPQPVVGMAATAGGGGYWVVTRTGEVLPFGDAATFKEVPVPAAPVVAIAATPTGRGYWLVTSAGDLFARGDAGSYGSLTGVDLNKPIAGIASTPNGEGYWMVATDGGIFAFGDAKFLGSMGGIPLNKPVVGMTPVS